MDGGRYVINYGTPGEGQEFTPEMPEGEARELFDRLGRLPAEARPTRLRLLLVIESKDAGV